MYNLKPIKENENVIFITLDITHSCNFKCPYCFQKIDKDNIKLSSLVRFFDKVLYRGNCRQGGLIGNINEDYSIDLNPIKCNKESCNCRTDFLVYKEKIDA